MWNHVESCQTLHFLLSDLSGVLHIPVSQNLRWFHFRCVLSPGTQPASPVHWEAQLATAHVFFHLVPDGPRWSACCCLLILMWEWINIVDPFLSHLEYVWGTLLKNDQVCEWYPIYEPCVWTITTWIFIPGNIAMASHSSSASYRTRHLSRNLPSRNSFTSLLSH